MDQLSDLIERIMLQKSALAPAAPLSTNLY